MSVFITEDFLLQNKTAVRLYHEYASRCRFMIIIAICLSVKSLRMAYLKI